MKYSEAAKKFNLCTLEEMGYPKDFQVKIEDNKILIDEDYVRGELLAEIA